MIIGEKGNIHLDCSCIGEAAHRELITAISDRKAILLKAKDSFKENSEIRSDIETNIKYLDYLAKEIPKIDICKKG